jgi:hypothetical protein
LLPDRTDLLAADDTHLWGRWCQLGLHVGFSSLNPFLSVGTPAFATMAENE